jgi:hypothetical protein
VSIGLLTRRDFTALINWTLLLFCMFLWGCALVSEGPEPQPRRGVQATTSEIVRTDVEETGASDSSPAESLARTDAEKADALDAHVAESTSQQSPLAISVPESLAVTDLSNDRGAVSSLSLEPMAVVAADGFRSADTHGERNENTKQKDPIITRVRYVSASGNDSNDGLSEQSPKATVYAALTDLVNSSTDGVAGGTVVISPDSTGAKPALAQPFGLLRRDAVGGIWIMGYQDPNLVAISTIGRIRNVVTLTATAPIPPSAYYRVGASISVFSVADPSFNGNFVISSISGSTITYRQKGARASSASGRVTPIGWIPQNAGGFDFRGIGGATTAGPGGIGPLTSVRGGQQSSNLLKITKIEQAGKTVMVTVPSTRDLFIGSPVKVSGVTQLGYDGWFTVTGIPSETTFTYENSVAGLKADDTGIAMAALPSIWLSGTADISFTGIEVLSPLPLLLGVDSNMSLTSSPPMANLHFTDCSFEVTSLDFPFSGFPTDYDSIGPNPLAGPATWIGSNVLWVYFDNCLFVANPLASVASDERAAVLMKSLPGGLTSGLVYFTHSNSTRGGGVRWYQQLGSSSVYIDGWLEEGTGQSQPIFEVMTPAGSLSADIRNVKISDSGDHHLSEFPGSTVPRVSPQAMGQVGMGAGQAINLQVDAARRNFTPAAVQFQNMTSQLPSTWTVAEGAGVVITPSTAPDGTSNAGAVTCTAKSRLDVCGVYVFHANHTFAAGDYIVADVWARAANHSAGPYTGFQGTFNLSGPTLSNTVHGSNLTDNNRASASPLDDGQWQRIFLWAKVAFSGTFMTSFRLDFTPTRPMIFYAPSLYFFSGNQIPPPPAPTVWQYAGGWLPATTYYVRTTYVSAIGETLSSAETTLDAPANSVITVASPAPVPNATGWNVYVGNTASCPGVGTTAISGPGQWCEVKQNMSPIALGTNWTEAIDGILFFQSWYSGANGPAGQTLPTNDSTNEYGDSEIASFALNMESVPDDVPAGSTVATMRGLNFAFGGSGDNFHGILDHATLTENRTYYFPNASGHVALLDTPQTWTAPQSFDSLAMDEATIDGEKLSSAPRAVYSAFLPGALTSSYTAATFTTERGTIVERVEITLKTAPQGCSSNPTIRVAGTKSWDFVVASNSFDSGPIDLPMDSPTPVQVILLMPALNCVVPPQDANVAIHYRMQ